jgi:hypothetical protein
MTEDEVGEALMAATSEGQSPVIQYLLEECGVNLALYGSLALRSALEKGHPEVVCLLLEAGTPTDGVSFSQAAQQCLRLCTSEQWNSLAQAATQYGHAQFADMLRGLRATGN